MGQDVYWMCSVDDGGPWLLRLVVACPTCYHRYDPDVDATWQHPNEEYFRGEESTADNRRSSPALVQSSIAGQSSGTTGTTSSAESEAEKISKERAAFEELVRSVDAVTVPEHPSAIVAFRDEVFTSPRSVDR